MQIKCDSTKPGFAPVKIELTFEDARELRAMWHRMNVSYKNIKNYTYDKGLKDFQHPVNFDIWEAINAIVIERKIDPYEIEEGD